MQVSKLINDRKIKIALVGCGRISACHLNAIQHHQANLALVALCDTDPVRLERAAQVYGVPAYPSFQTLLAESDADVVVLCTPSGLHAEQACLAAENSKHIITEKPMATRWQDGLRMVKASDKAGVSLFVVKQNR